jgi:hypothetical protein
MEVIKRTIYLEDSIDRTYNSKTWGMITASTFYLKISLTQNMDNMGLFVDTDFIEKNNTEPDYTILIDKLNSLGHIYPFMLGAKPQILTSFNNTERAALRISYKTLDDYLYYGNKQITGFTDSKLEDVRSYKATDPYRIGFDVKTETYLNYREISIVGVDRIKSMGDPKIYVFDTPVNNDLGTDKQINGIQYLDSNTTRTVSINGINQQVPITEFKYIGEGWNKTNTSLSALIQQEYLFGIISNPEVENDVFIDRGAISVMELHLRLSEINNIGELTRYGNGFYNINKQ